MELTTSVSTDEIQAMIERHIRRKFRTAIIENISLGETGASVVFRVGDKKKNKRGRKKKTEPDTTIVSVDESVVDESLHTDGAV